jgi:transposase
MAKELVSDELWNTIEPLLPEEPPKPKGGRPRVDDRAALAGIIFVLKSGIPWEMLPRRWVAAPASPAGDDCASGKRRGCGSVCTRSSWIASERPTE